jgi:hypothetical protein
MSVGDARARTWSAPCQPKNFLRPCLLLLLDEQPDYGYELRDRLSHFSGAHWDAGTIYRVLNAMEVRGLLIGFLERYERDRQAHLRGASVNGATVNGATANVPAAGESLVPALPAR